MAFDRLTDNIQSVSDKFQEYGTSTAEYYKLRLFKSSMKGAISLVNLLVFGSFFLFVLLFISIGVALWLGIVLESSFAGFLIVGGFYALVTIFLLVFGKKLIERSLLIKFSELLYDDEDEKSTVENEAHQEADTYKETIQNHSS
ncbi:phage holin family protein [Marixanthomonas sp. SCSIO 43207]|uniref:phage holin family protein n=1 Tax=Marixanthomonas sp. SCSIO 43207 TaxID=2779360 RepID=UPI001CA7F547|nr:phage holin family protein [Marixanthomonas sp. SCSIO 43207]UAB81945.1 phage holin family protein [Marixanthomonas sp. SCSIO 43207]